MIRLKKLNRLTKEELVNKLREIDLDLLVLEKKVNSMVLSAKDLKETIKLRRKC